MFSWQESLVAVVAFSSIGMGLAGLILLTRKKLVGDAPCKIVINDEFTKETAGGATLLDALLKNGIAVPSPCGGKATCKQCKVRVVEGAGQILEPDKATFSRRQLAEGWRLSCQCKVKRDLKVVLPQELLEVKEFEGKVFSNWNVATFIKELAVEIHEPIEYRSGAYLQLHVPPFRTNTSNWKKTMDPKYYPDWEKYEMFDRDIDYTNLSEIVRAYSMASYPTEGDVLKFTVRIATPPIANGKLIDAPWGIGSSYAFSLKEGDTVHFSGPYGESFMKEGNQELIFLIGGAGSSFGRSHIMHLFRVKNTKRKVTLWYGARSIRENIYEEEFRKLDEEFPNFSYRLALSAPLKEDFKAGWPTQEQDPIRTNYLFKAFELGQLKDMEAPEDCLYYVCGPPMHNLSVVKLLDDYGVPQENIVLDDFGN